MIASFKFVKSKDWDDPVKEKSYFYPPEEWMESLQAQADLLSENIRDMGEEEGLRYLKHFGYKFTRLAENSVEITLED